MKPVKNHVLVKPDPIEDISGGGIFIGAVPPPVHRRGEVIEVGDECETVKQGDIILYMPRRAVNADNMHVINEYDDILFIENKEAAIN